MFYTQIDRHVYIYTYIKTLKENEHLKLSYNGLSNEIYLSFKKKDYTINIFCDFFVFYTSNFLLIIHLYNFTLCTMGSHYDA